jgi:putative oxidoreductase
MMGRDPALVFPALGGVYGALTPVTEPLIRIVAGLSLVAHGVPKFTAMAANAAFFEKAGFAPGLLWAWIVGVTETAGGLCLALGLLTRIVSLPILIFLLTAVAYHWQFGFYWNQRGFEYPLFWAIVVFHFLIHGGGRWSIDRRLGCEV